MKINSKSVLVLLSVTIFLSFYSCNGQSNKLSTNNADNSVFLVELKPDNSIWCNSKTSATDTITNKVDAPIKENLKKIIVAFKENCKGEKGTCLYLIKGNNDSKYNDFKVILDAFKENEIYTFTLVTSSEDITRVIEKKKNPTISDLFEPKPKSVVESKYKNIETKLTLLLLKDSIIYGYSGNDIANGKTYSYSNVHKLISDELKKYRQKFVVIIKPGEVSYMNTVSILDEMTINKIKIFEMIDMSPEEKEFAKKLYGNAGR